MPAKLRATLGRNLGISAIEVCLKVSLPNIPSPIIVSRNFAKGRLPRLWKRITTILSTPKWSPSFENTTFAIPCHASILGAQKPAGADGCQWWGENAGGLYENIPIRLLGNRARGRRKGEHFLAFGLVMEHLVPKLQWQSCLKTTS